MTLQERLTVIDDSIKKGNYQDAFDHARLLTGELKALNRVVNPQEVNFVGIADEAIRRVVDPPFVTLAQSLDVAYYQHWKRGLAYDWHGYDVLPTAEENKAQFDRLSGLIWHEYAIALDDADQLRAPEERIPDKRKVGSADGKTTRQVAEEWIAAQGIQLPVSARPERATLPQLTATKDIVLSRR